MATDIERDDITMANGILKELEDLEEMIARQRQGKDKPILCWEDLVSAIKGRLCKITAAARAADNCFQEMVSSEENSK